MGFLKTLRQRHLAVLWLGQLLSALGDQFYMTAVVWLAIKVGGSAGGVVIAAGTTSRFVFGLLGGVYADRWNRRRTMITTDIVRGLAILTIPIITQSNDPALWHLALVAVVIGAADSLFNPALQASLPVLVDDEQDLQSMIVLLSMTRRLAHAAGPAIFGTLAAIVPMTAFFTLDAVSFGISAVAILSLSVKFKWQPEPQERERNGLAGITSEIKGAVKAVRQHKPLSLGLVTFGLGMLFWSAGFTVGVPLIVDRVLHADATMFGFISSAYGLGNVISNVMIGNMKIKRRVLVLFAGWGVLGIGFIILAAAQNVWIAMLGAFIGAFGGPMNGIMLMLIIQTDMPSNQIGKVFSLYLLLANVGGSLGVLLAGPLFMMMSVPTGIALMGICMAACGVVGLIQFGMEEPEILPLEST